MAEQSLRTSVSLFPHRRIFNYSCNLLPQIDRSDLILWNDRENMWKYKIFLKNSIQNHLQFWIQMSVLALFKQVYSISLTFLSLKSSCQRRNLERPFQTPPSISSAIFSFWCCATWAVADILGTFQLQLSQFQTSRRPAGTWFCTQYSTSMSRNIPHLLSNVIP